MKNGDHPCDGCGHFYGIYENNRCCNYIFDTGRPRPCEPGAGCTVRKKKPGGEKKGFCCTYSVQKEENVQ